MPAFDPSPPPAPPLAGAPPPVEFGPGYGPNGPGRYRRRRRRFALIFGGVFLAIVAVLFLVPFYPSWFGLGTSGGRLGPFGGFFLLFFVLIVVFFVVRVVFWTSRMGRYRGGLGGPGGGYGPNRPLMVARMRYARGEITREQYEQIVSDLGRRPGPP